MVKEKRITLKDEAVEDAYKKCQRERGKDDPMCVGLYAQAKAGMLSTDDFLDKTDQHIHRNRPKKVNDDEENIDAKDVVP